MVTKETCKAFARGLIPKLAEAQPDLMALETILCDCHGREPFEALMKAGVQPGWLVMYLLDYVRVTSNPQETAITVRPRCERIGSSKERKLELNTVRALARSLARTARLARNPNPRARDVRTNLERARELIGQFHKFGQESPFVPGAPLDTAWRRFGRSGTRESFAHLGNEMEAAIPSLSGWLVARPKFIFTARNDQQFRLLEHVRNVTGSWRYAAPPQASVGHP